ncbi:MAG TPA: alpha-ribazole phosphatase [Ohtaekwangia sp.]|uniref:alpha-ribazole phosphatase n=1 Tax=Ohtaekwangia sp. TaxID=2066019 RepID=UPI002F925675
MELYVIRHTTPDVAKGICYGQSDIPVLHTFTEEAGRVLLKLPATVDVIYTSPLLRCMQLAKTLAESKQVNLLTDSRLKELNFGNWELKAWNDIEQDSLMHWMNNYVEVCVPNGESYAQLAARVEDFLKFIRDQKHKTAAIVTHGGVIKSLHALINNISLKEAMRFQVMYGEVIGFKV